MSFEGAKAEAGEAATIRVIVNAEMVASPFGGPMVRLAFVSPDVLERLLLWRELRSATIKQMIEATYLPWAEQMAAVLVDS